MLMKEIKILLDIAQEISDVYSDPSASGFGHQSEKLETQVLAADGETIVMGGNETKRIRRRLNNELPVLGRIPVLGRLFRSNSKDNSKNNLMIFLRATVIRDDDGGATAEKYDYIRQQQLGQRKIGAFRVRIKPCLCCLN